MDLDGSAFFLSQLEHLQKHIEEVVKELRTLERYSIGATAVMWAWLGTHKIANELYVVYWVPMLLVSILFIKSLALKDRYRHVAEYIERVENQIDPNGTYGWQRSDERRKGWIPKWSHYFYIILIIVNFALAYNGEYVNDIANKAAQKGQPPTSAAP